MARLVVLREPCSLVLCTRGVLNGQEEKAKVHKCNNRGGVARVVDQLPTETVPNVNTVAMYVDTAATRTDTHNNLHTHTNEMRTC